jgi:carbonic anhydrase
MRMAQSWLVVVVALCVTPAWSGDQESGARPHAGSGHPAVHWTYEGDEGPVAWGELSPEYAACAKGQSQSPIDLPSVTLDDSEPTTSEFNLADLETRPDGHPDRVHNNGHTIQVDFAAGDTLIVGEERFQLVQLHFHAPSEHTVAGRSFPMEVHLVHRSDAGVLAVLGVLIAEGSHNAAYDSIWDHLPKQVGTHQTLADVTLGIDSLLPERRMALRYGGSLTTPPCSEGVRWFVFAEPVALSAEQIAQFTALYDHNNRPTQPLRGRSLVLQKVE